MLLQHISQFVIIPLLLKSIFDDLKSLRANTSKMAKKYAHLAKNATTALATKEILTEGIEKLRELYEVSVCTICRFEAQTFRHE